MKMMLFSPVTVSLAPTAEGNVKLSMTAISNKMRLYPPLWVPPVGHWGEEDLPCVIYWTVRKEICGTKPSFSSPYFQTHTEWQCGKESLADFEFRRPFWSAPTHSVGTLAYRCTQHFPEDLAFPHTLTLWNSSLRIWVWNQWELWQLNTSLHQTIYLRA